MTRRIVFPWLSTEVDGSMVCWPVADVDLRPWGIDAHVPAGFLSDGMSVPRFFWRFLGPRVEPVSACPAIVHDWLYLVHILTRAQSDAWLRDALVVNGYGRVKSSAVHLGLRLFGASHWQA